MKATAYRYNSINRNDRGFNNCGIEKNPNAVKFYASSLEYAENYRFVMTDDGEIDYECKLEVVELSNNNLFDMNSNFRSLNTYSLYINNQIGKQMDDYTSFMNNSKTKKDRKFWSEQITELENRESEIIITLVNQEFQPLSDFDLQNNLVEELTSKGYKGYTTTNEIAIF